jgi:hypothetical protein
MVVARVAGRARARNRAHARAHTHTHTHTHRYSLASEEAERIGVDHIAKVAGATGESDASEVALYLSTQKGAIDMLRQRVCLIRDYLLDVRDGKAPRDLDLLRQLSALCSRLPITSDDGGAHGGGHGFLASSNDAMLAS